MNRFRANLHPAFFDALRSNYSGIEKRSEGKEKKKNKKEEEKERELKSVEQQKEKEVAEEIKSRREEEVILETNIRRNNDVLASSTKPVETKEKKEQREQTNEEISKQLEKQLKQLAKNKKIDFPWTDNAWKCSRAEKKLATSSAKVFQQLLDAQTLTQMINKCKSKNGEITDQEAEAWKSELKINSKPKDIQNFYKAFKEYQNPQSEYQHLKNLMGFFCENDFSNIEGVKHALETRSQRITKSDIERGEKALYQEGMQNGEYVIIDNRTGEKIESKPKDWKKRASFEVIKDRLKDNQNSAEKMLTLLGDFNLDGEVNSGDVGYKTGTQVVDVFRRTVATENLKNKKFDDNAAIKNIVDYANKFGMDIQNVQTVDQLYQWMTNNKGYENTTKLQNFLRNLPIELTDVLTNGADAGAQSLENITSALKIEEAEKKKAVDAAKQKAKEIVSAGESKLKEVIKDDNERADITQQLLTQLPGMLLDKAMGEKNGLGVGYGVPLDQIIKGMSAGFNIGIGTDGKPKFGLFVGWDRKFDLSKTTDLRTAVSAGAKLLFVPCAAASMELGQEVNKKSREHSLDAKGEHRITLGGNVTAIPGVFSYGFSAGYENNKQRGIEKQAENINKVLKEQAKPWVEVLKTLKPEEGSKEITFEQKKEALKKALADKETGFPGTSPETLEAAANNLLSIIQQFKIDEKNTEKDFDIYAQIIADVYSEQWRNEKLSGIADNKRKISKGGVGIQFIAGCIPMATLVAKFTKYRNARTNETEHSRIARIDAQVSGIGNGENILEKLKVKELGEEQVKKQMNEILRRYGAKYSLDYRKGKDGKPGQILVPAGVADGIGINIRVSENLKGCVKNPGIKALGGPWYQFPANATYRLLQETGGNQRSLTLNIGSDKSAAGDIMISDAEGMKKLLGNNELMGGKKWQDKEAVTSKFEKAADQLSLLSNMEVALRDMDTDNRKAFSEFTRNKTQARENFNDVVKAFTDALEKSPKIDASAKKDFIEKFNALGDVDKQLIIDRVISIAAYYEDVHNEAGLNKRIEAREKRGDKYKTLTGPNGQPIFSEFGKDYRSDVVGKLKGSSYASESRPDILGTTAFYNRRLENDARGLGITGLGVTTVLGGKTVSLDEKDASKAKEWFLGSYGILRQDKEPNEWNNLKNIVKEKLPDRAKDKMGDENLKNLLNKGEVEIKLDNSEKKVKVNMNVDYVFYLMGECANESVGMQLGDLTVVENEEVNDYRQGELYLNNGDGSSLVSVSRKDAAIGLTAGGQRKEQKETGPENTPVGSDRADDGGKQFHTNDGENKDPENNPPEVNDDPNTKDTGGDEV